MSHIQQAPSRSHMYHPPTHCPTQLHPTQTISQETRQDTPCLTPPTADPASSSQPRQPSASAFVSLGASPMQNGPSNPPQPRTGMTETTRSTPTTNASSSANLPRPPTPACTLSASPTTPLTPVCLLAWTACVGTKLLLLSMSESGVGVRCWSRSWTSWEMIWGNWSGSWRA
jgi:hypothetical protein